MTTSKTPAAAWREAGEADPHGDTYNCERADLCLGRMTDDELANAVYLHDHKSLNADMSAFLSGHPMSIALLTAAKDRIRWLSRKLEEALANQRMPDANDAVVDAARPLFLALECGETTIEGVRDAFSRGSPSSCMTCPTMTSVSMTGAATRRLAPSGGHAWNRSSKSKGCGSWEVRPSTQATTALRLHPRSSAWQIRETSSACSMRASTTTSPARKCCPTVA